MNIFYTIEYLNEPVCNLKLYPLLMEHEFTVVTEKNLDIKCVKLGDLLKVSKSKC